MCIRDSVDIDLPVEAYLPEDYVPDLRHKIDLYRRMAKTNSASEVEGIREELIDRFGPIPEIAARMIELAELRLDAAAWQISAVTHDARFIVLHYTARARIEQLSLNSVVPFESWITRKRTYQYARRKSPARPNRRQRTIQAWTSIPQEAWDG